MDMQKIFAGYLAAPLLVVAAGVVPPAIPTQEGTASRQGEQKVCEQQREVGSQRIKRVCMTVAEREAAKEKAARVLSPGGRCSAQDSYCDSGL